MPARAPEPGAVGASSAGDTPGLAKRRVVFAGKLLLAGGLFWLLFELGLLEAGPLVSLVDAWQVLVAALVAAALHWPIAAWRWHMLLHVQGLKPAFRDTFRIAYGAAFVGLYLPGGIGFDIARIGLGMSLPQSKLPVLALSVVADRILGIMGLMLVGLFASAALAYFVPATPSNSMGAVVGIIAALFGGVLLAALVAAMAAPRLAQLAERRNWAQGNVLCRATAQAIVAARLFLTRPGVLAGGVGLSVVLHSLTLACLVIIAAGIGLGDVSIWKYALAGTMSLVVNSLPITPGGIGVGEAAFSQFMLLLEPQTGALPYASAFLAYRVVTAITLAPALAVIPSPLRRARAG